MGLLFNFVFIDLAFVSIATKIVASDNDVLTANITVYKEKIENCAFICNKSLRIAMLVVCGPSLVLPVGQASRT